MTRKEVRSYLRSKNVRFKVFCYAGQCADTIYLGKGDGVWYCPEEEVYVAFEYSSGGPLRFDDDSDLL